MKRWTWITLCVALTCVMLRKLCVQMMRLDGDLSVYYHSSNELMSGLSPYYAGTHYIYPPLFAWLIGPLANLSPVGYAIAWGLVLGACWWISILLVRRLIGETGWLTDVIPSLILFRAIWNGWGHGQVSLLMSAMLLAFLVLERERKLVHATFWLAFAGALKIFPFFMGVVLLAPRNWLYIPVLGAWTAFLTFLPAATVGLHETYRMIIDGFFGWGMARINNEHHLTVNHAPVPHLFQLLGIGSVSLLKLASLVLLVGITATLLLVKRPREDRSRDNLYLSFALTSCLMVCPHVWLHYFTLLLLPFAALLVEIRDQRGTMAAKVLGAGILVAGVAFNSGAKLFFSTKTSEWVDAVGIPSFGLLTLWLVLGFALLRPRTAPVPEKCAVPVADVSLA